MVFEKEKVNYKKCSKLVKIWARKKNLLKIDFPAVSGFIKELGIGVVYPWVHYIYARFQREDKTIELADLAVLLTTYLLLFKHDTLIRNKKPVIPFGIGFDYFHKKSISEVGIEELLLAVRADESILSSENTQKIKLRIKKTLEKIKKQKMNLGESKAFLLSFIVKQLKTNVEIFARGPFKPAHNVFISKAKMFKKMLKLEEEHFNSIVDITINKVLDERSKLRSARDFEQARRRKTKKNLIAKQKIELSKLKREHRIATQKLVKTPEQKVLYKPGEGELKPIQTQEHNKLVGVENTTNINLILTKKKLRYIPKEFMSKEVIQNVYSINLSCNNLGRDAIPSRNWLFWADKLVMLDLSSNQLTAQDIPDEISNLMALSFLNLSKNRFSRVPEVICSISQLRILMIDDNQIELFPDEFSKLRKLIYLSCTHNEITFLNKTFRQLNELQFLNLSNNRLDSPDILPNLLEMTKLKKVLLSYNPLCVHCEGKYQSSLVELEMKFTTVESILFSQQSGNPSRLQVLAASHGNLRSFSSRGLENVLILNLENNQLQSYDFSYFQSIQEIVLAKNRISKFDIALCRLFTLVSLNLQNNFIENLPAEICALSSLMNLNLKNNSITELPNTIGLMQNLQHFYISENFIATVHENIGGIKNLQSLDLACNRIESIPSSFQFLRKLVTLDLHQNQITALPEHVFPKMSSLYTLSLSNNKINCLPDDFSCTQKLHFLDLRKNKLRFIPVNVINFFNEDGKILQVEDNCLEEQPNTNFIRQVGPKYCKSYKLNFKNSGKFLQCYNIFVNEVKENNNIELKALENNIQSNFSGENNKHLVFFLRELYFSFKRLGKIPFYHLNTGEDLEETKRVIKNKENQKIITSNILQDFQNEEANRKYSIK
eukprot:snap_masked-scaffold_34-processed-gene-3.24-mRNA-1 protein AED:0.31 eAED:0.34 QI:0/-1/0/1/-1/1/1/0/888